MKAGAGTSAHGTGAALHPEEMWMGCSLLVGNKAGG